jgi:hypothetical protein
LENSTKAIPDGFPIFCGILTLVMVPYFESFFLNALSSVLYERLPTKSSLS